MKFNYEGLSLKSGIYKIINTHTNRIYIGSSHEFKTRWHNGHVSSLLKNKHQNKFLQADFNKCKEALGGTDDFLEFHVIQLMEGSTKEKRKLAEQVWIDKYFDNGKLCYNLKKKASVSRAEVPSKNPEETRQKHSKTSKELWANPVFREKLLEIPRFGENSASWGRKHTPEAIAKIKNARAKQTFSTEANAKRVQSRIGVPRSEETKRKIGEKNSHNMKQLWKTTERRQQMIDAARHNQTIETREKISIAMKGHKKSPETIERMREARRKLWADPLFRERIALSKK